MLSVEEFPSEEAPDDFIGHLDGSTYFQAAMRRASPEEQTRYNQVLDKIRKNNQTKAAESLANADEDLASNQGSLHDCAQESITLAIIPLQTHPHVLRRTFRFRRRMNC